MIIIKTFEQECREATTQEIADAATHDCHLCAQDYEFL